MLTVDEGDWRCGGAGSTVFHKLVDDKVERVQEMEGNGWVLLLFKVERRRKGKQFLL